MEEGIEELETKLSKAEAEIQTLQKKLADSNFKVAALEQELDTTEKNLVATTIKLNEKPPAVILMKLQTRWKTSLHLLSILTTHHNQAVPLSHWKIIAQSVNLRSNERTQR